MPNDMMAKTIGARTGCGGNARDTTALFAAPALHSLLEDASFAWIRGADAEKRGAQN